MNQLSTESWYSVILADPPWWYSNRKTGGERKDRTKFGGGAMKHYPLMKDIELLEFSDFIRTISNDNAALFVWATCPRLDFAIQWIEACGFRYVTNAFTWVKTKPGSTVPVYGPGYYTASNIELCLLGIRGKMKPEKEMTQSVIQAPRGAHSEKPIIHDLITAMYPHGNRCEIFARTTQEGWDTYGNETAPEIQTTLLKGIAHAGKSLLHGGCEQPTQPRLLGV